MKKIEKIVGNKYESRIKNRLEKLNLRDTSGFVLWSIAYEKYSIRSCDLCGHTPIKWQCYLLNREKGIELIVGTECVKNFPVKITPEFAERCNLPFPKGLEGKIITVEELIEKLKKYKKQIDSLILENFRKKEKNSKPLPAKEEGKAKLNEEGQSTNPSDRVAGETPAREEER